MVTGHAYLGPQVKAVLKGFIIGRGDGLEHEKVCLPVCLSGSFVLVRTHTQKTHQHAHMLQSKRFSEYRRMTHSGCVSALLFPPSLSSLAFLLLLFQSYLFSFSPLLSS